MMMIATNSHVRQKEEGSGGGGGRKASSIGTQMPGADAHTGPTQSGYRMRGTGENMDGGVEH